MEHICSNWRQHFRFIFYCKLCVCVCVMYQTRFDVRYVLNNMFVHRVVNICTFNIFLILFIYNSTKRVRQQTSSLGQIIMEVLTTGV